MMTFKKTSFSVAIVASGLLLTACQHSQTQQPDLSNLNSVQPSQQQEPNAQTYAANDNAQYQQNAQQQKLDGIYPVNSRQAPADQTYYFAFDSNQLMSAELAAMQVQARYLATHPRAKIRLEGNTDNRGSREYNVALGWRRDQSVEAYLEQQGVSPKQIEMVSYGKERPAVQGNNQQAWALNRRVQLKYKAY